MIPIGLNLYKKNVLLVGGGHVALRKAKLFLQEDATITVVSPSFLNDLVNLEVKCIEDTYQKNYLNDMFLVYACTDNSHVNQMIVDDCNALNILCGSSTRARNVSFHSMAFEKTEVGTIGLSTHQKMPYIKPLLHELTDVFTSHQKQLELLGKIRSYLVQTHQVNPLLLQKLYDAKEEVLVFLCDSIQAKKGYIFVYHQSDYPQQYSFELNPALIISLKQFEMLQEILIDGIDFEVIPLLLSDGYIYEKLKKMTKLKVNKPLITSEEDLKHIIQLCRYEGKKNYWLMHPRSKSDLITAFKQHIPTCDVVQTFDDLLHLEQGSHVVLLLMSEGRHYHELLQQLPKEVSVSKILPLDETIKKYFYSKRNGD